MGGRSRADASTPRGTTRAWHGDVKQGRVRDDAFCPADSHGAPCCPHAVQGPANEGSPDVLVNSRAALRVGDPGVHSSCCGSNKWKALEGSPTVLINGKRAHRVGDATEHCGGSGQLVEGSSDVYVGALGAGGAKEMPHDQSIPIEVKDAVGRTVKGVVAKIWCPHREHAPVRFDGTTTLTGLCMGSSVTLEKALQKGTWDPGTTRGTGVAVSHQLLGGGSDSEGGEA